MSVPTFPCPSGETCLAPECCAHGMCMRMDEATQPAVHPPTKGYLTFLEFLDHANECGGCDVCGSTLADRPITMADFFPADYEEEISDKEILDFVEAEGRRYAVLCGAGKKHGWNKPVLGAPSYLPLGDSLWIYPTFRDAVKAAIRENRTPPPPLDETEVCF